MRNLVSILYRSAVHPMLANRSSQLQLYLVEHHSLLHIFALMVVQINTKNLKDRGRWASGWLQKSEIEALTDLGATCQVCAGTGHMICPKCKNGPVLIM